MLEVTQTRVTAQTQLNRGSTEAFVLKYDTSSKWSSGKKKKKKSVDSRKWGSSTVELVVKRGQHFFFFPSVSFGKYATMVL